VSQSYEVRLNGHEVKSKMSVDFYNGRIRLYDMTPFLQPGENALAISVDSHTEKQLGETDRKQYPASTQHLNKVSGLAFYLRCRTAGAFTEIISDPSWRVRRNPEGNWLDPQLPDAAWAAAALLPEGVAPVDEAPSLEPVRRKDFANIPVELTEGLRAAVSTAALAKDVRAGLRAADPLQVAMDRPNREIVTTVRVAAPTTLQSLELTNGATLNNSLEWSSGHLAEAAKADPSAWVDGIYRRALARPPTNTEREAVLEMLGSPVRPEGVSDFLWALTLLPEFQFID